MVGRKSVYEDKVKSRFEDIEKWLRGGATEKQVAEMLGIAYSTFNRYKVEKKEFLEILKKADRKEVVCQLKSALLKKALGYTYEEIKEYIKKDKDGNDIEYTEINKRVAHPDVAAANLLLKNWDKENWSNDPQMLKLREKEIELKEKLAQEKIWEY